MLTHRIRFILATLAVVTLVVTFGYFSRYPDLNNKAVVAENHSVADTISMWPILKVTATDPMWKKIAYTTVNWTNDNKKGMAFGITLAALLSCWLSYLQFNPGGRFRSAFYGMILGSPLGVCVNCAAPVFKGALRSRRIEMALALMFASPTLNVVVLTMAFSLLPFYMAVTKIVFNLAIIMLGVPLLARWLKDAPVKDLQELETRLATESCAVPVKESFFGSVIGLLKDFWKQLSTIFIRTAPLMLVAGFLGASLSHLVPLDALQGQGGFIPMVIAATVGLILPVPMAFDVVLTNALFSAGLPQNVAMVLLLSLGVYSFYSFMITWQSASRRWALYIAGGLWMLIIPIGLLSPVLHEKFYMDPNIEDFRALTAASSGTTSSQATASLAAKAEPGRPLPPMEEIRVGDTTLQRMPFFPKQGDSGKFVQHEGPELGLKRGFMYTMRDYPDPFWVGRGTAAGDFDKDGWVDVALGSDQGPLLYRNVGGRFVEVPLTIPALQGARVFGVAFVDLDSDTWPDLFLTTFHRGNHWIRNNQGQFETTASPVPNGDGVLTVAPAFADLNGDGRIDIFNGNMVLGIATGFRAYGNGRKNGITWNQPDGFVFEALQGVDDGETMASLVSDINGDGFLDLYENNDFVVPDYLYFGSRNGLRRLKAPGITGFPTPYFSMSVDTADINNDLRMDLLITGTIAASQDLGDQAIDGVQAVDYKKAKDKVEYCDRIQDPDYRLNCQRNRRADHLIPFHRIKNLNVRDCLKIEDADQRDSCLLSMMWMIVTNNDEQCDCEERYGFDPRVLEVCQLMRKAGAFYKREQYAQEAPQTDRAILYMGQPDGGLGQVGKDRFNHPGGWTWSSRFVDLDNDGWVDIFNAEGAVRMGEFGWNVYMHNENGRFVQKQFSAGLTNDFNLFSFVMIDYDHDGDLDIIGNGSEGPVQVYENQSAGAHHSIAFALNSKSGNTANLNARVIVHPKSGPAQIREIKAGGGYQSVDAPWLYFGLGQESEVTKVEVQWPNGSKQEIQGPLQANALYRIEGP
ncbi:FG-GAP-like repeat-containing protein [Oligoflexus tunisiensis]|uniref:FG-GAP-like repeat-containing protein n=1 Tax=Oligoflexus tunisiensis TaxID=708132 RepID=UPI000B2F7BC1|nr:FG-GAP-like repeat-containing protein [Oligoflexus tunisiensis]